ncbi:uncharacterized protein LOC131238991 [Magnolia sinica]|uniref:uncharacterized protein LOC131238991 n=1 Tax=Magnolia sinica TaxID=86752 RepID=UPI002659529E|nr:uncharacterized protein LOC131238991 [Magnolia sinica]
MPGQPINLIGSPYKIIAKILTQRFKTILLKEISPSQSAFIASTQILDCPQICVCSTRFSILLNGFSLRYFAASRGLRLVDPSPPFLFLVIYEALGRMLTKGQEATLFQCFKVENISSRVSNLQFADNTIIFYEAKDFMVDNLHKITMCFEVASGLKINISKCEVLGVHRSEADVFGLASVF